MEKFAIFLLFAAALAIIVKFLYFPSAPEPGAYAAEHLDISGLEVKMLREDETLVHLQIVGPIANRGKRAMSKVTLAVSYKLTLYGGGEGTDGVRSGKVMVDVGRLAPGGEKTLQTRIATEKLPGKVNLTLWYDKEIESAAY